MEPKTTCLVLSDLCNFSPSRLSYFPSFHLKYFAAVLLRSRLLLAPLEYSYFVFTFAFELRQIMLKLDHATFQPFLRKSRSVIQATACFPILPIIFLGNALNVHLGTSSLCISFSEP